MAQTHTPPSCQPPRKRHRPQTIATPPSQQLCVDSVTDSLDRLSITPQSRRSRVPQSRQRLVYNVEGGDESDERKVVMLEQEYRHLVQYLMLYTDGKYWTSRYQNVAFWDSAGKFIQSQANTVHCRSGMTFLLFCKSLG